MSRKFVDADFMYSSFGLILDRISLKRLPQHTCLEVFGVNFDVLANQTGQTLFDALAQALFGDSLSKANVDEIHAETVDYILNEKWDVYKDFVQKTILRERNDKPPSPQKSSSKIRSSKVWTPAELPDPKEEFKACSFSEQNRGFMLELCAAAEKFQFTFGVVVFEPFKNAVARSNEEGFKLEFLRVEPEDFVTHVFNCEDSEILDHAYVKYYFLQSADSNGVHEWNYLQPKGPFYEVRNGIYDVKFKRVAKFHDNILYHANLLSDKRLQTTPTPNSSNLLNYIARLSMASARKRSMARIRTTITVPIVLEHSGREFFYRQYAYDDGTLFSILNHCLFDTHADHRLGIQLIIAMKRAEVAHFVEPVSERNETLNPQRGSGHQALRFCKYFDIGDVHDLSIASSIFAFSYELFLLDDNMNWYYERKKGPKGGRSEFKSRSTVHLVLFARTNELKFGMKWYRLEPLPTAMVPILDEDNDQNEEGDDVDLQLMAGTSTSFIAATSSTRFETEEEDDSGPQYSEPESKGTPCRDSDLSEAEAAASGLYTDEKSDESPHPTTSTSSMSSEEARARMPIFKSIPILFPDAQEPKSTNTIQIILGYIKKIFRLDSGPAPTKVFLVPKVYSPDKEIHEIGPEMAEILSGNIPWIASIPESEYFMVTANKNNPSTMLPFLAFHMAKGNDLERRDWGVTSSSENENSDLSHHDDDDDLPRLERLEAMQDKDTNANAGEEGSGATPPRRQAESYWYRVLHQTISTITRLSTSVGHRVRTLFVRNNRVHLVGEA